MQRMSIAPSLPRTPRGRSARTANSAPPPVATKKPAVNAADFASLFDLTGLPGYYNAAAKAALLGYAGKKSADQLFLDYSGPDTHVRLQAGGTAVLEGNWT